MTEDQLDLFKKARNSLAAARLLLDGGFPQFAVSRAYYTMFYVAEAFLEGEGMAFSKHSAVIAAFGQHFAHTGKVPLTFHKVLVEAERLRHQADYGLPDDMKFEQAQQQLAHAEQFVELAERLIGPLPPSPGEKA
jgi:uncharacterized protein (UPF0332 family)